jgi:hypothetical protein
MRSSTRGSSGSRRGRRCCHCAGLGLEEAGGRQPGWAAPGGLAMGSPVVSLERDPLGRDGELPAGIPGPTSHGPLLITQTHRRGAEIIATPHA